MVCCFSPPLLPLLHVCLQVRGVSGGERKRVTSGEMLVGNQRVLCMDEISTGLDSAILYSIIRSVHMLYCIVRPALGTVMCVRAY